MITKTELDQINHDFDLLSRCPDFPAQLAEWKAAAQAFRTKHHVREDVAYGSDPLEKVDLVYPETGATPPPVAIFYHGGSWQRLDKTVFSFVAAPLLARGIAVAIANYPLVPAVRIDAIVDSVRRSVTWLAAEAGRFGLDATRIGVFGHSAGGHLASMVYSGASAFSSEQAAAIKVVGSVGGFYDLQRVRIAAMNHSLSLDEREAERNSPLRRSDLLPCPYVVAVGGAETDEFKIGARRMADAVRLNGGEVESLVLDGQDHFSIIFDISKHSNAFMERIAERLV